ncbi:MAG TPA: hypothetical protein VIG46_07145 [Candidatus Baltobacteraceae bacterium]|jgi:hypothetical protein
MPRRPAPYESIRSQAQHNKWLKAGIWIFIVIFAMSAFGMIFAR